MAKHVPNDREGIQRTEPDPGPSKQRGIVGADEERVGDEAEEEGRELLEEVADAAVGPQSALVLLAVLDSPEIRAALAPRARLLVQGSHRREGGARLAK
eukprot:scaffold1066_cov115-Isochrysis_galbana.AAC.6